MIDTKTLITVGTEESMGIARDALALRGEHFQILELARRLAVASASAVSMAKANARGTTTFDWCDVQMQIAGIRVVCEQLETRYGDASRIEHENRELRSLMGEIAAQKSVVL